MKLNMWLIANRLTEYDIDVKITSAAERSLNGPLPFEASGSIYVHAEKSDVVCRSDQGTIIIRNVEEKEGLLLVQSIFYWYENWLETVERAVQAADFRQFVHLCAQAFSNPVMLQDSNAFLLGMDCRGIPFDRIPEWSDIFKKEYSSVAYYLAMSDALTNPVCKYTDCICRFNLHSQNAGGEAWRSSGLHAKFRYSHHDYGQLTILDKKRPLNPGDVALLTLLTEKSAPLFAAVGNGDGAAVSTWVMDDLLDRKSVSKEQLDHHYSIITRNSVNRLCKLCLYLFRFKSDERKVLAELLHTILTSKYPTLYSWIYHENVLLITYIPEPDVLARQICGDLQSIGYSDGLQVGVSLPFSELCDLPYYYEQAVYAADCAGTSVLNFFYDCAHLYLLENTDCRCKYLAAEPTCRALWDDESDKRDFLRTLSVYLAEERSTSLAAERLFLHRNTVTYRINYLKESCGWSFEDPSIRDYLRLSIHFLMQHDNN